MGSRIHEAKRRKLLDVFGSSDESSKEYGKGDPNDSDNDFVSISFNRKINRKVEVEDKQIEIWKEATKMASHHSKDDWRKSLKFTKLVDRYSRDSSAQVFQAHVKDAMMLELDKVKNKD